MRFKYLLLLLSIFNVFSLTATEQDSLSDVYLTAKSESIEFLTQHSNNKDYRDVFNHVQLQTSSLSSVQQSAFYIQYCKKYIKHSVLVDSLLNVSEYNLRTQGCERGLGEALFYMGIRATNEQDVDRLHSAFNEAATCFKNTGYAIGEVYALARVANFYSKTDNYKMAEKYYQEVLEMGEHSDDLNIKEMVYLNVANFYNEQIKIDEALRYYNMLEESIKESGNTKRLKPLYNNLGVIYYFQKDWNNAKKYLNKSLAIKVQEKDSLGMFGSYQNLFRISLKNKQLQDANRYYTILNDLNAQINVPTEQQLAFKFNVTDYHILNGNKEKALKTFHSYASKKDSVSNAVFSKKLLGLEESLEIERRDKEISLLQQKDELQQAEVKNLQVVIGFIIVFIIVLLINGYYMKRQWMKLLRADEQLKVKQGEIISVNKRLELSNKSKDRILSVIGHDLRGPVGGLKELVELYLELPELEPNDVVNLLNAARESSSSAYYLLENLLTWANSQRGDISFKPQTTPIYPVVKRSIDLLDQSINNKNIEFDIDIETNLSIRVDINMFRTILRNLVSNAIKHSPDKGLITVQATMRNADVHFVVSDEGLGMTAEETKHIFEKKETYYIGSEVSKKGTGLGLILCKEFVERHNGSIWVDSQKGIGTKVCFTIPKELFRLHEEAELQTEMVD
ncbi:tetratricopeptide repeat-containing sensor histidine kinase [Carboxylicivirga marina]|uniref:histidine kinase n=1 Tax=Carboxylicivirga marina TaxID=2800988 RepID=A0ABS1HND4_9BACT|nr:tetratricopeptide repeat-containing sensor histidine kinase [Carboxylicivirga marina]MBK3518955.1 tetratricopeptide repeat-containing sensor histidine kinase [Carboxylicivirga marina]